MIKRFSMIKIAKMSVLLLVVLILYFFPKNNEYELKSTLKNTNYHDIYLINKDGYVSKTDIIVSSLDKDKMALDLITSLVINSKNKNKIPFGFSSVIPENTEVQKIITDNDSITVSFSKEIMNTDIKDKMVECIVYTLTSINKVHKVYLQIDEEENEFFEKVYTRKIGINKSYDISTLHDIKQVTIYYVSDIDDNTYYIPVSKISNSNEDKIKIIIDELSSKSSYETNLISYINYETELMNYTLEDGDLRLYFNDAILNGSDSKILEEIKTCIEYSVKDSFDIRNIHYYSNNEEF